MGAKMKKKVLFHIMISIIGFKLVDIKTFSTIFTSSTEMWCHF